MKTYWLLSLIFSLFISFSSGEQCGRQANGTLCDNSLCCSEQGWCGYTEAYCKVPGCQSQCTSGELSGIITRSQFEEMFKCRDSDRCDAKGFYTYDAFITAAKSFPSFGTTGDIVTRKKEVASFFAQTSHQTTSGYPAAPGGQFAWGLCRKESSSKDISCEESATWPCVDGKSYYGRGPIMLTWNYNYGPCGKDIGVDLLDNPDIVSQDPVITFQTAIWFWMTAQPPKPSCHDVISGEWQPSHVDIAGGRFPGYGVITNIISGGEACGHGESANGEDRIGYYKNYSSTLGINPGDYLDCYSQKPFGSVELLSDAAL